MTISISANSDKISVVSPFNSDFVKDARNLGGNWSGGAWVFDAREEADVRAACMKHYGEDGFTKDTIDVLVTFMTEKFANRKPIVLFGRTVARAVGRDSGARIGNGVVLKSGGFKSGGSVKNWETIALKDTSVLLRDVSRSLVESFDSKDVSIEVIDQAITSKKALEEEREKLIARLAEIDKLLAE